ncbi:WD40-repeat-containing domain protein [Hygrophoropsis aurantiaca]|uniref:WD40-repeat-containing domain protein n=1 Tax=Hygrophoropsis aurantiaca TaxID=72124 RepID=A0ACB7ZW67_9AGAM|nr:WD40-repeat-containing domain protein [Hygrophoropsis aurantiaca]
MPARHLPLSYTRRCTLKDQDNGAITTLAFSPNGGHLAAGTVDGKLLVWSTSSRKLRFSVCGEAAVLSVAWTSVESSLLCGLEDGTVIAVNYSNILSTDAYKVHTRPVECLVVSANRVATGAHHQVSIWDYIEGEHWRLVSNLPSPPVIGSNRDTDAIVTALHWARTTYSPVTLLVSYRHHGIIFWDVVSEQIAHFFPVGTVVGSTSLSPDHRFLAVSNQSTGFDVYDLRSNSPVLTLSHDIGSQRSVPVCFVHNGHALLGGSSIGKICIWDVKSGDLLEDLSQNLKDSDAVLAFSAHYDLKRNKFFIAAAGEGAKHRVHIWETEKIYRKRDIFRLKDSASRMKLKQNAITVCMVFMMVAGLLAAYLLGKRDSRARE